MAVTARGSVRGLDAARSFAAGILTQGNTWFVRPHSGSDGGSGKSPQTAFATLAQALLVAVADQNDIVFLMAESDTIGTTTANQSAVLDWNKDGVHLIGVNAGNFSGKRSRLAPLSTVTAFANLFKVSANGCRIENIEFFQGAMNTDPSAASTCVLVSGGRNHFTNCQISGIGDSTLDDAGSNSLTITGNENTFDDCYIGYAGLIRATSVTEVILSGTPTRTVFRRCHFDTYTSSSTFKMITVPTGATPWVKFIDCDFVANQNLASAVAPTGLIGITTMAGQVLLRNPFLYGFAQYVTADNAYVQALGFNGLATGHLIGITQGIDAT